MQQEPSSTRENNEEKTVETPQVSTDQVAQTALDNSNVPAMQDPTASAPWATNCDEVITQGDVVESITSPICCCAEISQQNTAVTPDEETVETSQVSTDQVAQTALDNSNVPAMQDPTASAPWATNCDEVITQSDVVESITSPICCCAEISQQNTAVTPDEETVKTSQVSTTDQVAQTALDNSNVPAMQDPTASAPWATNCDEVITQSDVVESITSPICCCAEISQQNTAVTPDEETVKTSQVSTTDQVAQTALDNSNVSAMYDPTASAPWATNCEEVITQSDVVKSITSLIRCCAETAQQNTAATTDKEAVTILGGTGAGKSTSVNYWIGCDMVLKTPAELEEMGIEDMLENALIVHPDSERPGVTSIGHGRGSHTFVPQIIQDPNRATRVYIDCPGFSDNRGAEINIANAMNIRHALRQAGGVKAVFLTSCSSLISDRGECIQGLEHMCEQLFGGIDNLRRYQDSVLLGINRVPLQANLNRIRKSLTHGGSPTMQILAQRAFLYDPLEQGGAEFWSRDRFLAEIEQMPAIPQRLARRLFQTVLTSDDQVMLRSIVGYQVDAMSCALEQCDYPAADRCWRLLNQLRIIEHQEINELMEKQVRPRMHAYTERTAAVFARHAAQHDFTEAERLLVLLRSLQAHFPDENLVDLEGLEATLQTAKEQYNAQQAAEKQAEEARQRAGEARQREREERQRAERLEEERRRAEEEQQSARREREAMEREIRRKEAELEALRRRRKK